MPRLSAVTAALVLVAVLASPLPAPAITGRAALPVPAVTLASRRRS